MAPHQAGSSQERLLAVDSLRGLGALLVLLLHSREILWVGLGAVGAASGAMDPMWLLSLATYPLSLGACGVALFFVLSGYCIHRPNGRLLAEPGAGVDLRTHAVRRVWRIYPVLIAAMALTAVLDAYTARAVPGDPRLGVVSLRAALINLATLQDIAGPAFGSDGPLWSLGPEVQVYALYPLLFAACRRWGARPLLGISAFVSATAVALQLLFPHWIVPLLFPYLFAWICGMYFAEVEAGRSAPGIPAAPSLILLLGAACLAAQALLPTAAMLVEGPFFALVLAESVTGRLRPVWNLPWLRWLAWIGGFSYSLYVIHVPLLVFVRAAAFHGHRQSAFLLPYLGAALMVGLAWVFYQCVERFSLRPPAFLMRRKPKQA
jgi:peptidoglycan/LPS O-acetylase OafA/YrhL